MRSVKPCPVLYLLLMVVLSSCTGAGSGTQTEGAVSKPSREAGAWTELTPAELSTMLDTKEVFLVNVHIPYEGELPMTDAFIPFDQVGSRLSDLPGRNEMIALYCRTGRMSQVALQELAGAGYSNLFELKGGFEAWRSVGLPFIPQRIDR